MNSDKQLDMDFIEELSREVRVDGDESKDFLLEEQELDFNI